MNWNNRLGFACVIEGDKTLRASDTRKKDPHLRQSIANFHQVIDYLDKIEVRVFRLPSSFVPYATHPKFPDLHWKKQIKESKPELKELAERISESNLRLSFHPSQFVLLNSPRKEVVRASKEELLWQAEMLNLLGQGKEARVLIHVGGVYNERERARERMLKETSRLSKTILERFALENDDVSWNASEVYEIASESQVPMIFDLHHHACLPDGEPWEISLKKALSTWGDIRPKIHLSSPLLQQKEGRAPRMRSHSDYIDPWLWARFRKKVDQMQLSEFDVMLEAKRKDLALLELRKNDLLANCLP